SHNDRIDWDAANQAIKQHLKEHPDQDTAKQVAKAVSQRIKRSFSVGSLDKAPAWKQYQTEKKAQRSQSVHTQELTFDPTSRASSETIDPREALWGKIIQTATPHTRGQLNRLKQDRKEDALIKYLTTNLADFKGSEADGLEILKETVQQWLAAQEFPEE